MNRDLQAHIESTYHNLRLGVAVIGVALPFLLWIGGMRIGGESLQGSMSAYYYTSMRDVFVGALCAVGVALYLYKGFSRAENLTLNVAGVLAVCVALFPTSDCSERTFVNYVHAVSAIIFFLCLAYVSVFRASDTLSLVRDTSRAKRLQSLYRTLGVVMIASPVGALVFAWLVHSPGSKSSTVFFVEAFGVWAFGAYWLAKSWEVKQTSADRAASEGILREAPEFQGMPVPGKLFQIAPFDESVEELHRRALEQ